MRLGTTCFRRSLGACTTAILLLACGGEDTSNSNDGASTGGGGQSSLGGAANGGAAQGGAANGGAAQGGAANGGTAQGGTDSGGAPSGGSGVGGGSECGATGFHVEGTKVYDNHCKEFIMRGVNYPYTWYVSSSEQRFVDMASVGANSVRVVLSTGARWTRTTGSEVSSIIAWAKTNRMVAILEAHDSTGYAEQTDSVHPDDAVAYWLSPEILSAIGGNEAYVMINIANEPFGNTNSDEWASFHEGAVVTLRNGGIHHTLIVDAPNWGQDWENTMRDGAGSTAIFEADPDHNVIFSVHMYDVYGSSGTVTDYFTKFLTKGLPLLVGEFAADHGSSGDVDEATILAKAKELGVGYLGWSWSGNGSGLETLDITNNFSVDSLTSWGTRLIQGADGIEQTSALCTCFD